MRGFSTTLVATASRPIRQIRAGHRPRAISRSDRFVILVITGEPCGTGGFWFKMGCAGIFGEKGKIDAFLLLFGQAPGDITGALEGLLLGSLPGGLGGLMTSALEGAWFSLCLVGVMGVARR